MAIGKESELKFVCTPQELGTVKASPLLRDALGKAKPQRIVSRYFDTQKKYLWKRGVSLRIRQAGKRRVQTLKQETASPLDRGEWEEETTQETPDLNVWKRTPLASRFNKRKLQHRLQSHFEVDVDRLSATVDTGPAEIETVIDEGAIQTEDRILPVGEVEMELKSGTKSALFDFARKLTGQSQLHLNLISNAERGFLLRDRAWGRSVKATKPKLFPDMSCAESFAAICRSCLHDFMLNTQALETDDKVEAVHRARIAIRRLRAGLQLFKPIVCDDAYQHLDEELKWVSHLLGHARDLDVFHESTFLPAANAAAVLGACNLADFTESERDAAHQAVNSAINSERARALLIDLVAWIEDGDWHRSAAEAQSAVADFARAELKRRRKKLIKQGSDLDKIDRLERHKVRIMAKKFRYMAAFFEGVRDVAVKPKAMKQLLTCLEELQTRLGEIHDADARTQFLEAELPNLFNKGGHLAAFAAGALAQAPHDASSLLAKAVDAYSTMATTNPF